ncbi:MAG: hypothetical protein Q9216_004456 [Gyalolechia sp. 2 TL-2023]
MVSFWPWKGDDTSPASFDKALSALSTKLNKTNTKLNSLKQSSRRYSALWTLYTSFAYLLCAVVLVLVVGWREWGVAEYAGVVGGPIFIYLVRTTITSAYSFRIAKIQSQSDALQQQRDTTIEKLKAATGYNSTQELLKKYGGTPPSKEKPNGSTPQKGNPDQTRSPSSGHARTNFVPPPTANIPGRNGPLSLPGTPQQATPRSRNQQSLNTPSSAAASVPPWQDPTSALAPSAEFAPNAFPSAPQYDQPGGGPKWYDRLMDVVLGEDETLPRNRLALICHQCRLVNGQAPPGVQQLEEVGKWRCSGCNFMNGEEKEATRLLKQIQERTAPSLRAKEVTEDKNGLVDAEGVTEESTDEGSDYEQGVERSHDTIPSDSGEESPRRRGKTTGAQKGSDAARRRSTRVQGKAKR